MTFFQPGYEPKFIKAVNQLSQQSDYVRTDILLTLMLQRIHEVGLMERLVFKGGTMLRKMLFGKTGRLSTDLDFSVRSISLSPDDLVVDIMNDAFGQPYKGVSFAFDDKEYGVTDTSSRASPYCTIAGLGRVLIKLEVSRRADPILEPAVLPQLPQPYFPDLGFVPADVPCLQLEEAIGEKIRAAFQRNKIRDLHDLQQLQEHHSSKFDRNLVRKLAVMKLWEAPEKSETFTEFSHDTFAIRLKERARRKEFNEADLKSLLHRAAKVDLERMVDAVTRTYGFLADLSDVEKTLVADRHQKERELYERFRAEVRAEVAPEITSATP
jgi:predicted nucleotidyltransferase component of viral defense system